METKNDLATENTENTEVTEGHGVKWLKAARPALHVSAIGKRVAELLDRMYSGIYHVEDAVLNPKVDWTNERYIAVTVRGVMATWDFNELTRFVVLCHDLCVRGQMSAAGPGYMTLMFHPRQRTGGLSERHPTMEEAIEYVRRTPRL